MPSGRIRALWRSWRAAMVVRDPGGTLAHAQQRAASRGARGDPSGRCSAGIRQPRRERARRLATRRRADARALLAEGGGHRGLHVAVLRRLLPPVAPSGAPRVRDAADGGRPLGRLSRLGAVALPVAVGLRGVAAVADAQCTRADPLRLVGWWSVGGGSCMFLSVADLGAAASRRRRADRLRTVVWRRC